MDRISFRALLLTKIVDQKVWADVVPEEKTLPAIAYTHIVSGGERLLDGIKVNEWDNWRVIAIGNSRAECDAMTLLLEELDNTDTDTFKTIYIENTQSISSEPDDATFRNFVDIRTYDR